MKWDPPPGTHTFTFQVDDGTPVVVDPTVLGGNVANPVNFFGPANAPQKLVGWRLAVPASVSPSSAGATASQDVKVNNVFTAP